MVRRRSQATPVERRSARWPTARAASRRDDADALGALAEDRLAGEQLVVVVEPGVDGVDDRPSTSSSQPSGRSAAVPPGRMKLWFIRSPVVFSKNPNTISRSRKPKIIMVVEPRSMPLVANHMRCDDIRWSSARSMRIQVARGRELDPEKLSMASEKTSSLVSGER